MAVDTDRAWQEPFLGQPPPVNTHGVVGEGVSEGGDTFSGEEFWVFGMWAPVFSFVRHNGRMVQVVSGAGKKKVAQVVVSEQGFWYRKGAENWVFIVSKHD